MPISTIDTSSISAGGITTAKIAANAVTAAKLAREGSSGQVLTSNGAGSDPSYQALPNSGIGTGQTWQNVGGSRSLNTTYYNTTGKPILVCVNVAQNGSTPGVVVDGQAVCQSTTVNGYSNVQASTAIVPNGSSYYAYGGVSSWYELR